MAKSYKAANQADGEAVSGDAQLEYWKSCYRRDKEKADTWRKEAEEDFKFRDGEQYSEDEKKTLQAQMRPAIVFNRTGVLVDAVTGAEVGNRREVRYIPREMADAKPNELLSAAAEWFRDICDAEDEESEAFKDTVTAGMGWTETRLDFTDNPEGEPKVEHLDPMEMVWDSDAVKANLVDAKRLWRVRRMDGEAAKNMFPGVDEALLHAAWAEGEEEDGNPRHIDPTKRYQREAQSDQANDKRCLIVAHQYFEQETYYRALILAPGETSDPMASTAMAQPMPMPQEVELDEEKFKIAQSAGVVVKAARLTRQRVMQVFLGQTVLKKPEPVQTGGFSWSCITGLKDHDKGTFYGIVRRAKDPQRWANKWLSQMMHILNSQAKGGVMAEAGVFADIRTAERDWAKPEGITELKKGALQNGQIQPKPVAQFPAGFDRLLQYADDAIIKATGINMELLGIREVNQPGVLEHQRKQQGIAILAAFFDSLRRYRKIQGRLMLKLIQTYLADGRLVRIVGDEQAQYVPLMKEQVADSEYDIIVDDAPTSTNEKERTWTLLTQLLPMFKDAIGPQQALLLAEYSPLPTSLVEKMKAMLQEQQQGTGQPDPMQQAAMQLEQGKMALEAEKIQLEMAKVQADREKTAMEMMKIQLEAGTSAMEQQTERQRIQSDGLGHIASIQSAQAQPVRTN